MVGSEAGSTKIQAEVAISERHARGTGADIQERTAEGISERLEWGIDGRLGEGAWVWIG